MGYVSYIQGWDPQLLAQSRVTRLGKGWFGGASTAAAGDYLRFKFERRSQDHLREKIESDIFS